MLVSSGQYRYDKLIGVDVNGNGVGIARVRLGRMPRSGLLAGRKTVTGRWLAAAYDDPGALVGPAVPGPMPRPAPAPRPSPSVGSGLPSRYRRR